MTRKSEVEALAKVLWEADEVCCYRPRNRIRWPDAPEAQQTSFRAMARAAIAHLSKPKRGVKRGKA